MIVRERRTALVVDDEPWVRQTLQEFLKLSGYEVNTAAGGEEALAQSMVQEFDFVLLDIRMPGLSGMEVLGRLQDTCPDTAVIMVTAVDDAKTAIEAMKKGAYDYVIKPFDLDDILVRVRKGCEKRYLTLQIKNYQNNLEQRLAQQALELRALTTRTIQNLIKEEVEVRGLEARTGKHKGLQTGTDIKEFGSKILHRLSGK